MAVLVLMVVTVIGILATRTANIEQKIATSDKIHKMTWYATDAVVDGLMPELIEQNIAKRGFGDETPPFNYNENNNLTIFKTDFYLNEECTIPGVNPSDISVNGFSNTYVSVTVFGRIELSPGNAIQLPEGYHGRGKGMAGGGAQIIYTIRGLGTGVDRSSAMIQSGWRHLT